MIIGDFVLLVLFLGGAAYLVSLFGSHRHRMLAGRLPPMIRATDDIEMNQVNRYYRLAKRMAHQLDSLATQDEQLPFMSTQRREEIQALLDEWELL